MKPFLTLTVACACSFVVLASHAESIRQYCEEMYPVESYEAEEREQYVAECVATSDSYRESGSDDYYGGTVEDFVNSIPEEPADNEE